MSQIFVRVLDKTYIHNIEPNDTVLHLRYKIQDTTGVFHELLKLTYMSSIALEDDKTLSHYGITTNSTVYATIKFRINTVISGNIRSMNFKKTEKISSDHTFNYTFIKDIVDPNKINDSVTVLVDNKTVPCTVIYNKMTFILTCRPKDPLPDGANGIITLNENCFGPLEGSYSTEFTVIDSHDDDNRDDIDDRVLKFLIKMENTDKVLHTVILKDYENIYLAILDNIKKQGICITELYGEMGDFLMPLTSDDDILLLYQYDNLKDDLHEKTLIVV